MKICRKICQKVIMNQLPLLVLVSQGNNLGLGSYKNRRQISYEML